MLVWTLSRGSLPRDVTAQLLQQAVHIVPLRLLPPRSLGPFSGRTRLLFGCATGQNGFGMDWRLASEFDLGKCGCDASRY